MIIWLELHCDGGLDFNPDCVNHDHEYPAARASTVGIAVEAAKGQALSRGWKRKGQRDWYCPACSRALSL